MAGETNTIVKEKWKGHSWKQGETQFTYLWPVDVTYEGNNDSLLLFLQHKGFRMLLTGDLEKEGEQDLMSMYGSSIRDLTVLKAGHHGSKTSSSEPFITFTNPRLTIFSAGLNNRYGHPHKEVIARFEQHKLPYKVTAVDGTIMLEVNHRGVMLK